MEARWVSMHPEKANRLAEIPIPCDPDVRGGTPSYRTPLEREPQPADRALERFRVAARGGV